MEDPPRLIFVKGDKTFCNAYINSSHSTYTMSGTWHPEKLSAFWASPSLYPWGQGEQNCHYYQN